MEVQDLYLFDNRLFVSYSYLFKRGVSEQSVYNLTSKNNKNSWKVVRHPSNNRCKLIEYNSIQKKYFELYKLPEAKKLEEKARRQEMKNKKESDEKSKLFVKNILDIEYDCWIELKPLYENLFIDSEIIECYCKTHIIFQKCKELYELGTRLKDLYNAYSRYDDLIFQTQSYSAFCNKFKKIRERDSIDDVLIHGLKGRISNNKRISSDVIVEIKRHFSDSKRLNASHILERVNEYLIKSNRQRISISSIYKVISQPYVKIDCLEGRMGMKYVKYNILPHNHFIPPKNEGTVWFLDGTRLQFAYKDKKSKYKTLIFYVVVDGKSKKILGYSSDVSENTEMAIEAVKMACCKTSILPRELVQDRSPAHRSLKYERLISQAKLLGVLWRPCYNPRDNNYVERLFGVLQERFCKTIDGYLGDGIRSKNPVGKPAPEELERQLKEKNIRTREELEKVLEKLIFDYNNSKFRIDKEEKLNREQAYRKIEVEPISINSIDFASMFWEEKEIIVSKGSIVFKVEGRNYYYNIYKKEVLTYFNQKVRVCFNPDDLSNVFLFDLKTGNYIGSLERYIPRPKARIERSEADNLYIKSESKKGRQLAHELIIGVKNIKEQSKKQNVNLPPDIAILSSMKKRVLEDSEADLTTNEILNYKNIEKKSRIVIKEELVDFEKLFKDMYKFNRDL